MGVDIIAESRVDRPEVGGPRRAPRDEGVTGAHVILQLTLEDHNNATRVDFVNIRKFRFLKSGNPDVWKSGNPTFGNSLKKISKSKSTSSKMSARSGFAGNKDSHFR